MIKSYRFQLVYVAGALYCHRITFVVHTRYHGLIALMVQSAVRQDQTVPQEASVYAHSLRSCARHRRSRPFNRVVS